jgi:hypothetical protein
MGGAFKTLELFSPLFSEERRDGKQIFDSTNTKEYGTENSLSLTSPCMHPQTACTGK